jgi:putative serine protease PepD
MVSLKVLVRAAPILAGVAALAGCGGTSHPGTMSPSAETIQGKFVNVVKTVSPAVVQIQTSSGLGSGVVFDARGNVVTNNHVVGGAKRFTATLSGGKRVPATLVGTSPGNDLALNSPDRRDAVAGHVRRLLEDRGRLPGPGDREPARPALERLSGHRLLGQPNRVRGNGVTLTSAIQTSAEINPGNSGGALADLNGRVIGIPTLAALDPEFGGTPAPGIGFAIASNRVKTVATSIIAGS